MDELGGSSITDDSIVIRFHSDEEEERSRRFTVHRHYLESIDQFLGLVYGAVLSAGVTWAAHWYHWSRRASSSVERILPGSRS